MPKSAEYLPAYRHYAPKNLAVVRLNGRDIYLGTYNSPESRAKYDRVLAEWLANKRQPTLRRANTPPPEVTVDKLFLRFLKHAEEYYVQEGQPTSEVAAFKSVIRVAKLLYGQLPVSKFGPFKLKAIQQHLIVAGISRGQINLRIGRLKRIFDWGVSEELVEPKTSDALKRVKGLRRGRTKARETKKVRPVPLAQVLAILPYLSPQVATMVQVQLLAGMRPGEVTQMRPQDIDRSAAIWIYQPARHKTAYLDRERRVAIGPQAQALLPFLERAPDAYLFSPQEAEQWRLDRRAQTRSPLRKTKVYPCEQRAREARKQARKARRLIRRRRERYDVASYRQAIGYGIVRARHRATMCPIGIRTDCGIRKGQRCGKRMASRQLTPCTDRRPQAHRVRTAAPIRTRTLRAD